MSTVYKFNQEDLFYNRVKTYPKKDFLIYDAKVYIDGGKNAGIKNHTTTVNENNVPQGFISLYELNVASNINTGTGAPPDGTSIYPFVTKEGARIAFRSISTSVFDSTSQFAYGDFIKSHYPLSSSIFRTRFAATTTSTSTVEEENGSFVKASLNKQRIIALKNTFNNYVPQSIHHAFSATSIDDHLNAKVSWDKSNQEMSLIEIPSIFYGSSIRKGSVSLKFYITGTLAAELQDVNQNGELVQVSGTIDSTTNSNKVAGLVLYNEGFIALTGSWDINPNFQDKYVGGNYSSPKWYNFGAGANDGTAAAALTGSAFTVHFEGTNQIPTITMFAHAKKGELNNSTNPTFIQKDQDESSIPSTSSYHFYENSKLKIKNLEHNKYGDSGSFDKQTYISKIGIYDDNMNLIAIAKLASPVRKTETRDLTFKLKMDF
ncbi:hypothetical protein N9989_00185 [bacterium]|jgi:hypothetical protein|nr:hypothetical protein [bacterium]